MTSAKQRLSQLHEFQGQVDNTWKGMRWIMDVLTYARDRQVSGGIPLHLLYDRFEVWSPATYSVRYERDRSCGLGMIPTSIGSGRSIDSFRLSSYHSCGRLPTQKDKGCSSRVSAVLSPPSEKKHWNRRIVQRKSSNIPKSFSDSFSSLGIVDIKVTVTDNADAMNSDDLMRLTPNLRSSSSGEIPLEDSSFNLAVSNKVYLKTADWNTPTYCAPDEFVKPSCSGRDDVNNDGEEEDHVIVRHQKGNTVSTSVSEPGILRVHAAYETGLDGGASIRLHVTPQTTAREVIDLVVKQLNMTAIIKEKENVVYTQEHLQQFCLVAVIGARERCLRDDFCPLKLQNPWTSGRLYVRLKNDVLAAIQHQPSLPDSNDGDETVLEVPQPTSI